MKQLLIKLGLFFILLLVFNLISVIITPINLFTFRSWEALTPLLLSFDGAYYPNQTINIVEVGDLAKGTEFAIPKPVTFVTDAHGFRNLGPDTAHYEIVIVGDSMTAGSSLTQDDTLAVVLSSKLGISVYAYAPASMESYLGDARFAESPPEFVVLESAERSLSLDICPPDLDSIEPLHDASVPSDAFLQAKVLGDRFLRNPIYLQNFIRSDSLTKHPIRNDSGMVFFAKSLEPRNTPSDVEQFALALKRCEDVLESRGSQMIFLQIPDKENVYFDDIPGNRRPDMTHSERRAFVADLTERLEFENTAVVDLLPVFEQAREEGITPYQLDDTHWNRIGVEDAADLLTGLIATNLANT